MLLRISTGISVLELTMLRFTARQDVYDGSPLNSGNLTLETKSAGRVEIHQPPLPHTHTGLVEDFVNHLKTGEPIRCSGKSGLKTNAIIAADLCGWKLIYSSGLQTRSVLHAHAALIPSYRSIVQSFRPPTSTIHRSLSAFSQVVLIPIPYATVAKGGCGQSAED